MASLAQMLLGNSALTQPDAPVVTPTPTFQPEDAVARQYKLADALRNVPAAHSWAGVLANGLGAVGGNLIQGDANNALASNQALRKTDIQNAANATDLPSLEKSLIGAQTPDIQTLGLNAKIKSLSDDPAQNFRVRAAQAIQYGLQPGTPEFRSFVLTGKMPDPLDAEYKRAQIGKLNAETANAGSTYGKAGTIVQGSDGSFYSIQFGSGGQRKIEKLEIGGSQPTLPAAVAETAPVAQGDGYLGVGAGLPDRAAPSQSAVSLTPSRGVGVEGNLMYDKATGETVRDVGTNVAEGERQKVIGRETGQGQMNLPKTTAGYEQAKIQNEVVLGNIDKAIKQSGAWTTGFAGSVISSVPGTPAHDLGRTLDSIKSNLGFDKLQAMRDASPTGGALGQVSEMENRLLQSVWGSVEQSQSQQQLVENLNQIKSLRQRFQALKQQAYEQDVARFGKANVPDPETGKLPTDTGTSGSTPTSTRPRAVNPQTGQTLEFDGQNWIEAR